MELVYPPVVLAAKAMFKILGLKIDVQGAEHIPEHGGAAIACTHHSYLDFIFCGLGAQPAKRLVRFMAKKQVFDNRISGPLMRGMHHIPVDRSAGRNAFDEAVARLRDGEVVGVFPEATISRSFTVKDLKTGTVRMAADADVPIVPMAMWGTQRLWTKGRPRNLSQRGVAISIRIGEPFAAAAGASVEESTGQLRVRMQQLLDGAQADYPSRPATDADRWWLPGHRGGTAPTPAEAAELDERSRDRD